MLSDRHADLYRQVRRKPGPVQFGGVPSGGEQRAVRGVGQGELPAQSQHGGEVEEGGGGVVAVGDLRVAEATTHMGGGQRRGGGE
jgi:hypothetical protein